MRSSRSRPGLRMHVAEAGNPDAPTVLLLHGFPQHWWEWRKVIPPLAERYRVVVPDLRGAGWTDAPADGYTVGDVLADVLALLDALRLRRVGLVAHDFSAFVGFRLCFDHPERVAGFLCLGPHPYLAVFTGRLHAQGHLRQRRLTVPTVSLMGGADAGVRPGMLDVYGRQADDLVGHIIDGAAHFLADDRPDAVVTHALTLFGRVL